jgi:hypothetical protein
MAARSAATASLRAATSMAEVAQRSGNCGIRRWPWKQKAGCRMIVSQDVV